MEIVKLVLSILLSIVIVVIGIILLLSLKFLGVVVIVAFFVYTAINDWRDL